MTGMCRMLGRVFAGFVALASMAASDAAAAPAPAGAYIESTATVQFINPQNGGMQEVVFTNTVYTEVNAVKAVHVFPAQTVYLAPSMYDQFVFHVRNTGNIEINPVITLDQVLGDDFDLENVSMVIDTNSDGSAGPNDQALSSGGNIKLPVDAEASIIVTFRSPAAVAEGARSELELTAQDDPAVSSATGTAIISKTGLSLEKAANLDQVKPGGLLRYRLRLSNRGIVAMPAYSSIDGEAVIIDAAQASGILVRDEMPLNTQFSAFVSHNSFQALYHISGQPKHSYTSTAPQDLATVDAIAFFWSGDYPLDTNTLEFEVKVADNATGGSFISNRGYTWQFTPDGLKELPSNLLRTLVEGGNGPTLSFLNSGGEVITSTRLDTEVRLRFDDAACNMSAAVETVQINVMTTPEGDLETFTATETGPNTGIFLTALVPVQRILPPVQGDGVLSGNKNTLAQATATCQGRTATATLRINPGGVVFHSITNAGIPNVPVLIHNSSGQLVDQVVTDADGFYTFSKVTTAGTYQITVQPPAGMTFPSARKIFLGWNRNVDPLASYGQPFGVSPPPFDGVDIPLDPQTAGMLKLEKSIDQREAAPGDILTYKLRLSSRAEQTLSNLFIIDELPEGLTFLEGTARFNGQEVPTSRNNRQLVFSVNEIGRFATLELTYMVSVDPLANGKLTNIAYAEGGYQRSIRSNEARAVVSIIRDGGVFGDDGVILGKVYVDYNGSGLQDTYIDVEGTERVEPGIPGVKIFFENGASVVTDIEGKYSMPGLSPRSHVVGISGRTIPESLELKSTSTRDAMSPYSRLIRLMPGEVASEYFALVPKPGVDPLAVVEDLTERATKYVERISNSTATSSMRPSMGGTAWVDYDKGTLANSTEATRSTQTEIIQFKGDQATESLDVETETVSLERTRNLEEEVRRLTPELAFLDLSSDDLIDDQVVSIRVKGAFGEKIDLNINGAPVPETQIGQHVIYEDGGVQAIEYVAVALQGGRNRLELTASDAFGNVRQREEIEILAPGKPARLEIVTPPVATADPASPVPVLIRVVDADGLPTFASMDVTLDVNGNGRWGVDDARLSEPGIQAFIDRGQILLDYFPPSLSGTHTISVSSGLGRFEAEIKLLPDDGERVIVGVMEGVVRLNGEKIETIDLDNFDKTAAGARGALYLKGKIKGDALLTLRYDSNRSAEERLFRDIDPERYYPVYGDRSERGFDAQSKTDLFVKVEKGLNYILYGDVSIAAQASQIQLGSYSRVMTGGHAHIEQGPVVINLFVGRTNQERVIREFRADGISGPYDFDLTGYVEGSERVEIITRDRRQPTVILKTTVLQRYTEYLLDYFNNSILFTSPVPASDEQGNPNFIRVTYEVKDGGDPYWVYAGEVQFRINDRMSVGYREIHSDADEQYNDRRTMRAAYAAADFGKYGKAEVEVAQSIDREDKKGYAGRVGYEVKNDLVTLRARATRVGENFIEGSSSSTSARDQAGIEAEWNIGSGLGLRTSVLYDRQLSTDKHRWGGELLVSQDVSNEMRLRGGVRVVQQISESGSTERRFSPSAVLGAEWRPAALKGFTIKAEIEGEVPDLKHLRGMIEASHPVTERIRAYSSANWATSGSDFLDFSDASNEIKTTAKAGIEYRVTDGISSFTEARSGDQTGLAGGVKGDWKWTDSRQIYAMIEHFQPYAFNGLRGSLLFPDVKNDASARTSVSAGYLELLDGGTGKFSVGAEATFDHGGGRTFYSQQSWSRRIEDWTFGLENRFAWNGGDRDRRLRDHLRAGLALRPEAESLDALFVGGLRFDRNLTDETAKTTAYWAAASSVAIDSDTRLTAKQAGQYQRANVINVSAQTFLLLVQMGLEKDIAVRDDLRVRFALNAPLFYDVYNDRYYTGVGGEIGFVPARNVLVAAGYNWSNVDATGVSEIYQTGPYVRLAMKLDDSLWNLFDRGIAVPVSSPEAEPPVYYK